MISSIRERKSQKIKIKIEREQARFEVIRNTHFGPTVWKGIVLLVREERRVEWPL